MSETAKWYVVHTYSGYENKVAQSIQTVVDNQNLHDLFEEIKVPTETVLEVKDNKQHEVERKVFPGYVFIKMILSDDSWYVVRNIRGVTGFVGPGSKPVPLSEKEVVALGVETKQIEINYAVGDTVKVISGPLDGFIGVVTSIDTEKNIVTTTVSMFGRDTAVELELGQLTIA
ncbi:MAG: transcription termination/antitermination protein NusG [Oscillospiraceae bacterium]